ncbi:MAG: hypothetical protein ABIQ88_22220 [Chitinophagaceae bacterium]
MQIKIVSALFFSSFLFIAGVHTLKGQPSAPALAAPVVVDLKKHTIGEIPFDKPYYFTGDLDTSWHVSSITFEIMKGRSGGTYDTIETISVGTRTQFTVIAGVVEKDFLLPDRVYTLNVTCRRADGSLIINYSFHWGLLARSKIGDHVKLDFGIAYAPTPKALIGYTSVNIYFTAINDETNLKEIKNISRNIFLRTSVFIGLSPVTFSSDTKQDLKNKYSTGNIVFGVAVRSPFYGCYTKGIGRVGQKLLQPMRLSFGEMLYAQVNANPLITKNANKGAFFVGLSYDLNIASLLGPIAKIIAP